MAVRITTAMLDQFGVNGHSVDGCGRIREILFGAGVRDVELHPYEVHEIGKLRAEAARITKRADAIEARGPWPDREVVVPDADVAGE